jgi:hypothetical protein
MNFLTIFGLLLGTAEDIVPIFIHNPQSQKIEGAIVTTTNNLFSTILALQQAKNAPPVSAPTPVSTLPVTPSSQAA